MIITVQPPSIPTMHSAIMREIVDVLDTTLRAAQKEAEYEMRIFTGKILINSLFFDSCVNGIMRGEFGFRPTEALSKLNSIVLQIANDTHLFYRPIKLLGGSIVGGWTLAMGTNLFDAIKIDPAGIQITEKGQSLPWFEWSIERGDAVIIIDYKILFRDGYGRSEMAIMKEQRAGSWRVEPLFSGTDHDNWITREVEARLDSYERILSKAIKKYLP